MPISLHESKNLDSLSTQIQQLKSMVEKNPEIDLGSGPLSKIELEKNTAQEMISDLQNMIKNEDYNDPDELDEEQTPEALKKDWEDQIKAYEKNLENLEKMETETFSAISRLEKLQSNPATLILTIPNYFTKAQITSILESVSIQLKNSHLALNEKILLNEFKMKLEHAKDNITNETSYDDIHIHLAPSELHFLSNIKEAKEAMSIREVTLQLEDILKDLESEQKRLLKTNREATTNFDPPH